VRSEFRLTAAREWLESEEKIEKVKLIKSERLGEDRAQLSVPTRANGKLILNFACLSRRAEAETDRKLISREVADEESGGKSQAKASLISQFSFIFCRRRDLGFMLETFFPFFDKNFDISLHLPPLAFVNGSEVS
jgi:hypothetical protein